MTEGEEPRWAPPGTGPPAEQATQPLPPGAGGPLWPGPPPHPAGAPPTEGLAVAALVLAVVSLLVPVLPAIVALVLAAVAAQRIRHAPGGAVGRGLVTGAVALSTIGLLVWVGLAALLVGVTQHEEPTGRPAATASGTAGADQFSEVTAPPATEPPATEPPTTQTQGRRRQDRRQTDPRRRIQ